MTEKISDFDPSLILLDEETDFQTHALKAVQGGHRKIYLLSEVLDEAVYNTDAFRDAVRTLATGDRYCEVRILVKDIKPLVEHGHRLLELARRLSSKVAMRKLTVPPQNNDMAYLIVGNATLLYKYDDKIHNGYVNYQAAAKCKLLIEEFNHLWEAYGELDPALRYQLI